MYYNIYTSDDNYISFNGNNIDIHIIDSDSNTDECTICLNTEIDNKSNLIKLQSYNKFITSCDCNIICHEYCLQKWFSNTKSCPICRKIIISNIIRLELSNQNSSLFIITNFIFI